MCRNQTMSRSFYVLTLITVFVATCNLVSGQSPEEALQVNFSVVHDFSGGADGAFPGYAALIFDSAANLYGATTQGGVQTGACTPTGGCGTIFKIDPSGDESVFYAFSGASNGPRLPYGTLLRDVKGNFYGTTWGGGSSGPNACNGYGCGTVYKVSASGQEKTIYNFSGGSDGATPTAALTVGADGKVYSTTHNGGINPAGVVFAIGQTGDESVIFY